MMEMGFPVFELNDVERDRTVQLDELVFNRLSIESITERYMWTAPPSPAPRFISLRVAGRTEPIARFTPEEFATLPDSEIIARISAGIV
ncbi:hypothetical protein [Gemmata sp.]|uniref:hypothetical protein n=1 Tax=Gemmata sp. TaxID=1914242 RepID=UPI003F6E8C91